MKVYSVLLIIIFSLTTNVFSQVQFTPHTITSGADYARSVYAEDVDGDGDMDVLSASTTDDKIAWYENLSPVGIVNNDLQIVPVKSFLYRNYPNPFNPSTTIMFDLPKSSEVSLKVFNILGEEVATLVSERLSTGSYSYDWDASNLASGVYLYRLQAGDYIETRKMILMK